MLPQMSPPGLFEPVASEYHGFPTPESRTPSPDLIALLTMRPLSAIIGPMPLVPRGAGEAETGADTATTVAVLG